MSATPLRSFAVVLFTSIVLSDYSALAADTSTHFFDIRDTADNSQDSWFVVICARPVDAPKTGTEKFPHLSPGHAWIVFGHEDARASACTVEKAYGFWPREEGTAQLLNEVPGKLADEILDQKKGLEHQKISHRVIFRVSEKQSKKGLAEVARWQQQDPPYQTLAQNCTHFTHSIIHSLGVSIDYRTAEFPTAYLDRIGEVLKRRSGPAK